MAGKYLWISLLVTIQISVALCRSTEKTYDEDKEGIVKSIGLSEMGKLLEASNFTNGTGDAILKDAVPSEMAYDVYIDRDTYVSYEHAQTDAAIIVAITMSVFIFLSLVLGCIMYCVCKKAPRRGFIVNTNTGGQTNGLQQPGTVMPGTLGNVQPMQHYPPSYGQMQQQNIYPPVCEAK